MSKILLCGVTGTVVKDIVKELITRGLVPRVISRDPDRARSLLGASTEVVGGDLTDRASLTDAMRGVAVAYVATAPGHDIAEQEGNFIEAARAAKLRRVVKLSGFGVEHGTDRIHKGHGTSEMLLKSSGLGYVILKPVMFMSNLLWEAASIKEGQIVSTFGDGRMSFIDPRDVSAVAVVALTAPGLQNEEWAFGGPEPLSYDDVAAAFSRVLGRAVKHLRLDSETFRREAQLPDLVIEAIIATADMARQGKYEVPDVLIQEKLGRRANNLERWIEAHRAAFTG
jgi:uncharacterized protein YbjT (DUF2867 family)